MPATPGTARFAPLLTAGVLAVGVLGAGGCSAGGPPPSSASLTSATGDASPVLGRASRPNVRGVGAARPSVIDRGGDPAAVIDDVFWRSWGGPIAEGTGRAVWIAPGAPPSSGAPEQATVVATDLGDCGGRPAYRSLGRYFPKHGQSRPDGLTPVCDA